MEDLSVFLTVVAQQSIYYTPQSPTEIQNRGGSFSQKIESASPLS
jgi:hypothetical protein